MNARETEPALSHPMYHGVRLAPSAAAEGGRLSSAANWNQTERDWNFLLQTGHGFGFETAEGHLIASAVVTPYGNEIAWVSMVLVSAEFRRQGLAAALLRHALSLAAREDRACLLDATPEGRKVYAALGFHDLYGITRWTAPAPTRTHPPKIDSRIGPLTEIESWIAWDEIRFGPARGALMRELATGRPDLALQHNERALTARGFCLGRSGRLATQVGPITADTADAAHALLCGALDQVAVPVICDVVDGRTALEDELKSRGFAPQRTFTRMAAGVVKGGGIATGEGVFLTAGPELG